MFARQDEGLKAYSTAEPLSNFAGDQNCVFWRGANFILDRLWLHNSKTGWPATVALPCPANDMPPGMTQCLRLQFKKKKRRNAEGHWANLLPPSP